MYALLQNNVNQNIHPHLHQDLQTLAVVHYETQTYQKKQEY